MFITLTHDHVHFEYGSNHWQYNFNEIVELGLLKKKKTYLLINTAFILVTAIAYYCMIFSELTDLYYILPTLICYSLLIILRLDNKEDCEYFVIVKDIYKNEKRVKIKALDRPAIGKKIDQYLSLEFDRLLQAHQPNLSK